MAMDSCGMTREEGITIIQRLRGVIPRREITRFHSDDNYSREPGSPACQFLCLGEDGHFLLIRVAEGAR